MDDRGYPGTSCRRPIRASTKVPDAPYGDRRGHLRWRLDARGTAADRGGACADAALQPRDDPEGLWRAGQERIGGARARARQLRRARATTDGRAVALPFPGGRWHDLADLSA